MSEAKNEHRHPETLPHDFDWNEIYSGHERDYMPPDPLVLRVLEGLSPGSALDVGCGAGGLVVALAQTGWEAHGVDIAANAIASARKVVARAGVPATLEVADATSWRPSHTYDLVTNCFALPMTRADQVEVLRTIRDAVAPGGTVVIKDFDPQMSRISSFAGIDLVSVSQLEEAFEGFEIVRAEVVDTPVHDHGHGSLGEERWTAALLVARRPG